MLTVSVFVSGFNLYSSSWSCLMAGPFWGLPFRSNEEPWQGHISWPSSKFWIRQPKCVQYDENTRGFSAFTTMQSSWKSTSLLSFSEILIVFFRALFCCTLTMEPHKPKQAVPIATPKAFMKYLRERLSFSNAASLWQNYQFRYV